MAQFDLLFVGSGFSSSFTLIRLLEQLQVQPPAHRISIAVVDPGGGFHGGSAYGAASGDTEPLLLTSLRSFLPDTERTAFLEWFGQNHHLVPRAWAQAHRHQIDVGAIEDLCLPRSVFGTYVKALVTDTSERARQNDLATVTLVAGEVIHLRPTSGGYEAQTRSGTTLHARRAVVAVGAPPATLPHVLHGTADAATRVLVIGGNAAAAEAIYLGEQRAAAGGLVAPGWTVLTPSGRLPDRHCVANPEMVVPTPTLDAVAAQAAFTAEDVCVAASADLENGRAITPNFADVYGPVTARVGGLLSRLGPDQQAPLADGLGHRLGKLTRWVGNDYADAIDKAGADDRLRVVAGTYSDLVAAEPNSDVQVRYTDTNGCEVTSAESFDLVLHCAGAGSVSSASSSELLSSLSERYRPNPSGRGFVVNDSFALDDGLYIMGPLLAGNVLAGRAVWHMEQASRIFDYSRKLGRDLATVVRQD
jgi:uncharacterized NAD(P)/FAD-binding protein YdhS